MSGASLCLGVSAQRIEPLISLILLVLPRSTMKNCCQEAGELPPKGPIRRWLSYLLYAAVAAVLGFVLSQQWQA
jgi:hypothetical protein